MRDFSPPLLISPQGSIRPASRASLLNRSIREGKLDIVVMGILYIVVLQMRSKRNISTAVDSYGCMRQARGGVFCAP